MELTEEQFDGLVKYLTRAAEDLVDVGNNLKRVQEILADLYQEPKPVTNRRRIRKQPTE